MYWQEAQKSYTPGVILKGERILGEKLVREIKFCRHGSYISMMRRYAMWHVPHHHNETNNPQQIFLFFTRFITN